MNEHGQPIGVPIPDWKPAGRPSRTPIQGRTCRVEALDVPRHAADLFAAFQTDTSGKMWTYMTYGPFETAADFGAWLERDCVGEDPLFHAIIDASSGKAVGLAAYLRIVPEHGVIEIGHLAFSPLMQRATMATEAIYLMMRRAFNELGYRRYEWKCDALNAPSRKAAERFGFTYDGLFEQAVIYKGRNRDTAWYSILDRDWPRIERAFAAWLDAGNFDAAGQQQSKLSTPL